MGTSHSFAHRLTALSMACLASAAIIFSVFAGLSCSFVQVQAKSGRNVMTATGDLLDVQVGYLGVMCEDSLFYDETDRMWSLSQLFFYFSVGFGSLTAVLAWMLTFCIPPTGCRWRTMSILSAITAVMEVPVFLIFESDNCNFDIHRQTCKLAMGAYLNMMSVILWVVMTIWTQCLKVPKWDKEGLKMWKVDTTNNRSQSSSEQIGEPRSFYSTESGGSEEEDLANPPQAPIRWMGQTPCGSDSRRQGEHSGTSTQSPEPPLESREGRGQHRGKKSARCSSRRTLSQDEVLDYAAQHDASCMERILARSGTRNTKKQKHWNQPSASCMSLPVEVDGHGLIEGVAGTVMQSLTNQSNATCHKFPSMDYSMPGPPHDTVCTSSLACHDGIHTADGDNESFGATDAPYVSRDAATGGNASASSSEANVDLSCVTQVKQLPIAMAACIVSSCDVEQQEPQEFHIVAGVPERVSNNSRPSSREGMDTENKKKTHRIDYLTKRLQTDMVAAAKVRTKSKTAPMKFIQLDTSYIQENDNDDVSAMTRGSGLASGVSEVLDSQRRQEKEDLLTILKDLAKTS
jgi:hypothetical protein